MSECVTRQEPEGMNDDVTAIEEGKNNDHHERQAKEDEEEVVVEEIDDDDNDDDDEELDPRVEVCFKLNYYRTVEAKEIENISL